MGKKLPNTPRSQIRSALRRLWLRSRERAAALKNAGRCCQECGVKASVAKGKEVKIEVHHKEGIDWEGLIDIVASRVLQDPSKLKALCVECHKREEK